MDLKVPGEFNSPIPLKLQTQSIVSRAIKQQGLKNQGLQILKL